VLNNKCFDYKAWRTYAQVARWCFNYRDTSTSKPSDSFPGLTAIVSGGSPRIEGAFYDVAYDHSLDPPDDYDR